MRLGELLLHAKLITRDALDDALESQVVHGGRLGTNLVELGHVQEADLARTLGQQHQVAYASGHMVPDQVALKLVASNFADDKDLLPMRVDATRLTVAMVNPRDIEARDQLGFKTGKRVVPVVVPEFRMNQLLRRYCKAFRPMRAVDMDSMRPQAKKVEEKKGASASADLMSEEEFQSLYAQALQGGAGEAAEEPAGLEEVIVGEVLEEAAPAQPSPPPAVSAPAPAPVSTPAPRAAAPAAPEPPLAFAEAQKALQQSQSRDDVGRTILRFAAGKWKRALLFSVQRDLITGWLGAGAGLQNQIVGRIGVPLRAQSTFRLVRDTRSHHIGPMKRDPSTALFYQTLGGAFPTTAVLLPLLVRGKVVHMLYVDNGPGQLTPPDVGELLILSQSVARSYEAMFQRRAQGG